MTEQQKAEESKINYPILGYAPGSYQNRCVNCKDLFIGDKRAVQCEPCAINLLKIQAAKCQDIKEKLEGINRYYDLQHGGVIFENNNLNGNLVMWKDIEKIIEEL